MLASCGAGLRKWVIGLLSPAALVLSLFGGHAARAETVIVLEPYVGKLRQVGVRIADSDHKFLFDAAGGRTLISPALASALGCRPEGRTVGHRNNGEPFATAKCMNVTLSIGQVALKNEVVGVYDLTAMLPKEFPAVGGLISLKSFDGRTIALDLGANTLIVDGAAGGRALPFRCRAATGADGADLSLFALVERAGAEFWFE
jgi:hypothetical protein